MLHLAGQDERPTIDGDPVVTGDELLREVGELIASRLQLVPLTDPRRATLTTLCLAARVRPLQSFGGQDQ